MTTEATATGKKIVDTATDMAYEAQDLADRAVEIALKASDAALASGGNGAAFWITGLTVLLLAGFLGYYVVWNVTPALHSPLMSVTNAISSVVIVGAILAAGAATGFGSGVIAFLAVALASINIFGGFAITHRMLSMFR